MWAAMSRELRSVLAARFFTSLVYFVLLPTLAILLLGPPFQFTTFQIALLMGVFAISDRGLGIFLVPTISLTNVKELIVG